MNSLADSPWLGAALLRASHAETTQSHEDFGVVLAATLTLLGLIIGFIFSMAINRYDQRKTYEEAEANAQPTPMLALVASGMNDVLDSQGYAQASWSNRIPLAAWLLMAVIAMLCTAMIGYSAARTRRIRLALLVLPFAVAVSFMLIADIDSPRGGQIRVEPQNLLSLAALLH